jgi:hypothetical protein
VISLAGQPERQPEPEKTDGAAVVTHAGVLHAVFSVLGLEPPERFTPGGITRIAMEEGGASVLSLDDRRHLDDAS